MSRTKFETSASKSNELLELIHSYVVGPMETPSIGGAKYILTFVDDFSKKVFVYFLNAKSEVFKNF
jgi:hypothetical protein